MDLLRFEDYLGKYHNINSQEWSTLYEKINKKEDGIKHDIFGFCALIDYDDDYIKKYLNRFEWGFNPGSFGHSYFEKISTNNNGTFDEEIYFETGEYEDNFEYLIAYRNFNRKYQTQIEINPKLIWYKNLVKVDGGYLDPVSDEFVIRTSEMKVEVLTSYLRDFLCAYNQACVISFDHRRFAFLKDKPQVVQKPLVNDTSYCLYSLNTYKYDDYNVYASIIGKSIIKPYTECQHSSLKYLLDEEEYEDFIYDIDDDTGKPKIYTCDGNKLANYFGANPEAPHFLTPVYFNKTVLNRYKTDTANYTINDGLIRYLDEWDIPFSVNEEEKVVVWLGDLGRIPYEEQRYWKSENIPPKGEMDENFWKQQIEAVWVDRILPEKWLFTLINQVNDQFRNKYDAIIFNALSEADKYIYSTFMIPVINNIEEFNEYLMQFCKITVESINKETIKKFVSSDKLKDEQGQSLGSIGQLGVLFKELGITIGENLISSIKLIYNARNKLSGHTGSIEAYNRLWRRNAAYSPNWIIDSKMLLNSVNEALSDLIEELK